MAQETQIRSASPMRGLLIVSLLALVVILSTQMYQPLREAKYRWLSYLASLTLPATSPQRKNTELLLANECILSGKHAEAENLFRAIADTKSQEGFLAYQYLAVSMAIRGDVTGVERIARILAGHNPNDIGRSMKSIGYLVEQDGFFEKSIPVFERAREIMESQKPANIDQSQLSQCLYNLASCYHRQGNIVKARPLYERALPLLQQTMGENDWFTKSCRTNMSVLPSQ